MATAKATVTITIAPAPLPPLTLDASQVPTSGQVGAPYSGQFGVSGGTPPDGPVTVDSGSLPDGLSLTPQGLLEGTPSAPGAFTFEVNVSDSGV